MKLIYILCAIFSLQLVYGPEYSESIRPVIKLRPKIVLGKALKHHLYDDDIFSYYRIIGKTILGCYLLGAIRRPYYLGDYKSPLSVTFSVGKKVESGNSDKESSSSSKNRHHHHHHEDEDDDHDHRHHRSKSYDKSSDKEVKHIIVSHKFVDQGMSIPMDTIMPAVFDSSGIVSPTVSQSSGAWPSSGSVDSISSFHTSSNSPAYSSSTPIASIVYRRKKSKNSRLMKQLRSTEKDDDKEEDVEDDRREGGEEEEVEEEADEVQEERKEKKRGTNSGIYSYRDQTVDEPKGYRFAFNKGNSKDELKYSASTNLNLKTNQGASSVDKNGEQKSEQFEEEVEEDDESSIFFDSPTEATTTIANSTRPVELTSPLIIVESVKLSEHNSSSSSNSTTTSSEKPLTREEADFLEDVRKLEKSLMLERRQSLNSKLNRKSTSSSSSSFVKKLTDYDENSSSITEGKIARRKRKKNRKSVKLNRNYRHKNGRRRRRRKNGLIPIRNRFNSLTASYPILLPAGSRPFLPQDQYADRFSIAQEKTRAILGSSYANF